MAENGRIRPSDLGGPDDFKSLEKKARFGDSADRPPDLSAFSNGKSKAKDVIHPLYVANTEDSTKSAGAKFLERQKLREERENFLAKEKAEFTAALRPSTTGNSTLSLKELVKAQESAKRAYAALRQKRMHDTK